MNAKWSISNQPVLAAVLPAAIVVRRAFCARKRYSDYRETRYCLPATQA